MTPGLALAVSLLTALAGRELGALTSGGALAALGVGAAVLWATGWEGAAVLAMFFLPSTLVGRWGASRPGVSDARGERRDQVQVLANGAAAALGACAERFSPGLGYWMLTGALSAASADTWATSLGARSRRDPRDLVSGRPVPRGTSGGVSLLGTLGGLGGAVIVSGTAALARNDVALLLAGTGIGVAGMFLDSLLGATVQVRFRCPACGTSSERRRHRCGTRTELVGGWRWLDNDGVNAVTTLIAAVAAALLWR